MTTIVRLPFLVLFFALLLAAMTSVAENIEIDMEADLLTVEVRDAPLSEVVRAIGERAGFETMVVGDLDMPVNAAFTGVPVREALDRLLGDTNRVIVSGADRAIARVWLLGSGGTADDIVVTEPEHEILDADLRHPDAKTRSEAVLKLANLGATEPVLAALIRVLLEDEDALVRSRAAIVLGKLGDERAVPALESALSEEHGSVRAQVIHALGLIDGENATLALGDVLLHSTDNTERVIAAQALARQDTELARQYLDAVADDSDQQVRAASRSNAGQIQGEQRGSENIR